MDTLNTVRFFKHQSVSSSGNIIATDGGVGGILGYRYGSYSIENCYSIANVKAEGSYSSSVYGIGCSAKNCYFAGTISGTGDVYPIGEYKPNSYYDSEKTKISGKPGALTTKQMKNRHHSRVGTSIISGLFRRV